jgi:hypothetical protein
MPALWKSDAVAVLGEPTQTKERSARGHEKPSSKKVCVMNLTIRVLWFRV